jgi:hypothetical protein
VLVFAGAGWLAGWLALKEADLGTKTMCQDSRIFYLYPGGKNASY